MDTRRHIGAALSMAVLCLCAGLADVAEAADPAPLRRSYFGESRYTQLEKRVTRMRESVAKLEGELNNAKAEYLDALAANEQAQRDAQRAHTGETVVIRRLLRELDGADAVVAATEDLDAARRRLVAARNAVTAELEADERYNAMEATMRRAYDDVVKLRFSGDDPDRLMTLMRFVLDLDTVINHARQAMLDRDTAYLQARAEMRSAQGQLVVARRAVHEAARTSPDRLDARDAAATTTVDAADARRRLAEAQARLNLTHDAHKRAAEELDKLTRQLDNLVEYTLRP
ncbi:MAG: hypothetical protein GC159_04780 [Phycisphaera sp.]|nr:hypothetical protein [Phycisphaera sp.]